MAKGGLGRGLGALIPGGQNDPRRQVRPVPKSGQQPVGASDSTLDIAAELATPATPPQTANTTDMPLLMVPVENIRPNTMQPRQTFAEDKLRELADSIREHGVLQPIVVSKLELPPPPPRPGRKPEPVQLYQIIAGERRYRASKLAGLTSIPVIVKEVTNEERLTLALIENIQRADLGPLEEAQAYRTLINQFSLTHDQVAKRVGKSRTSVTNTLRVLDSTPETIDALSNGDITMGHAIALRGISDREAELAVLNKTIEEGLSVRAVEALAQKVEREGLSGLDDAGDLRGVTVSSHVRATPSNADRRLAAEDTALAERFQGALGTRVNFVRSGKRGRLVIFFDNEEILQDLYARIVGQDDL